MRNVVVIYLLVISVAVHAQVFTNHMVAYYPFNGNANDMSGNGYNGTAMGTSWSLDRFGNPNSACSFNGVSDYIDLSSYISYLNFSEPASFSFWISTKHDECMSVFSTYNGASNDIGSVIYIGNNATGTLNDELITVFQRSSYSNYYLTGFTTTNRSLLMNSGWHHVVVVYDGILTKVYLDNVLLPLTCSWGVNNGQYGNLTVAQYASIGARYSNGYGGFFNGFLDDVRIYNIALTHEQVDTLFNEVATSANTNTEKHFIIGIYPNPAKKNINVRSNASILDAELFNLIGVSVSVSFERITENEYVVGCPEIPSGICLLRLWDGNTFHTERVIIRDE